MIKQLATTLLSITFIGFHLAYSQNDEGFIYGKISTIDDVTYEGPIRWGKEEVYWTDMFNAGKRKNENISYLTREEMDELRRHHHRHQNWGFMVHFDWDWEDEFNHQFGCQFGEIKRLIVTGRERIEVELQNGVRMELEGDGYNDVGAKIRVLDQELGEVELKWSRINQIEFLPASKKLDRKFGEPLYGTVETRAGSFTGFVQWDHDERVSTDVLDGDTRDGDLSIEFGRIKSIERDGSGSNVILQSGRELYLRGSNDVNYDNKGIIVTTDFGRVDIEWREFRKVTFINPSGSGKSYRDFRDQKELSGTVKTEDGESYSGRLVYDLDEAYDFEVLQGEDRDEIEYIIPFRNIASIKPMGYDESEITLRNGQKLRLEDGQDVSEEHTGILVFSDNREPIYIEWREVAVVLFE